ncbi:SIR2 family protein [Sporomusa acidovorans]|uniref:SIR2-like domain-containing protein n=1 Tax=Sporomusa acidovorans (strain ATCC 49682 / DSM 3132 / Mol) TaxID=1123286 RepID=A0ABZ3J563_SPOA4|nr:SIR2 family protein [Sporomusa acidovorans]OZC15589.1 hypothetical protein SPACI_48930 [Sporomusa acidovorans DSM 3132]SDE19009.1 SIR2-like domain-containing protein [Sporomusa acidovorans]
MEKTAIFLGGGASAAEGAPVQSRLFEKYFKTLRVKHNYSNYKQVSELQAYFRQLFFIDVLQDDLNAICFPTFEEAIGILDLAIRKRQCFKDFDLENLMQGSNRIGYVRQYLILLMAEVLEDKTSEVKGLHRVMTNRLAELGYLQDIIFISTNYDVLLDRALAAKDDIIVDYGVEFTNYSIGSAAKSNKPVVKLYKVHGSLNWSYCPTCNLLQLITDRQGILKLLTDPSQAKCDVCQTIKSPVIVPPTFFKDMSNNFLTLVWHQAEISLSEIRHLIFCGYSFPDADMHIKYLIKRIQTNRTEPLRITVINNYPGKKAEKMKEEEERYSRFLGSGICFTNSSFEDFCNCPEDFI